MLAMMPVVAEEQVANPSVQTEANNNAGATKGSENKSIIKGAGDVVDSGIMSVPYYLGYGVSGVASGLKTVAKYTIGLPFRMAGWGIDGAFGEGTTQGILNKTSTGLKGGLAVALTYGAYKGLNRFAKYMAISDIKNAFEAGGEKGELNGVMYVFKYGSKTHLSAKTFLSALATELKKRFEYTDLLSYMKNPLKEYKEIILVCDKIEELVGQAIESKINFDADSICTIARTNSTGKLFGAFNPLKLNILNGYCNDALVLYAKIIYARNTIDNDMQLEQSPKIVAEVRKAEASKYQDMIAKLNVRVSKGIVKK
jgi:hypothetical protein